MTEKKIQIRVNTDVLRDLLDQNPGAQLELEAFAAEKIAEQLVKKFIAKKEDEIRLQIREQLDKQITLPKFPNFELTEFAKKLIGSEVDRALACAVAARGQELADRIADSAEDKTLQRLNAVVVKEREEREAFVTRLSEWWTTQAIKLEDDMKKLARDEFMKVIAEVSGVFGKKES